MIDNYEVCLHVILSLFFFQIRQNHCELVKSKTIFSELSISKVIARAVTTTACELEDVGTPSKLYTMGRTATNWEERGEIEEESSMKSSKTGGTSQEGEVFHLTEHLPYFSFNTKTTTTYYVRFSLVRRRERRKYTNCTAKRILERLGIQTSSSFVKI